MNLRIKNFVAEKSKACIRFSEILWVNLFFILYYIMRNFIFKISVVFLFGVPSALLVACSEQQDRSSASALLIASSDQQEAPPFVPELVTFDASPLYEVLSGSDMLKIFGDNDPSEEGRKLLFETWDKEDITQFIDCFTVNTTAYDRVMPSVPDYVMCFYKNDKKIATLRIIASRIITWKWVRGSWDWRADFSLTDESEHRFVSWFCEKTGESPEKVRPQREGDLPYF